MSETAISSAFATSYADLEALDPDAWAQLYVEARPVLWRFANTRLATAEQAEDAVSDTMVRAMAAIGRFRASSDRSGGIIGWLVGIERNVIYEIYRAGARLRAVPFAQESVAAEPADRLVADDEARAVRFAFALLPDDDRELLGLRVVANLDSATTARILGKRPGAVRMAQARALGRLRVTLNEADRER